MRTLRPWLILFLLASLVAGVWAGFRQLNAVFCEVALQKIHLELEKEGMRGEVGKLTLDPVRGLVAQKVKLFAGPERDDLLASFNTLRLDVDIGHFLRKEQFFNTIELDNANLSLPLDPDNPKGGSLKFTRFSSRVVVSGDRFEIRKASGDLYGIRVNLTGSVLRPSAKPKREGMKNPLELIHEHRAIVAEVIHQLHRLRYEGPVAPRLDLRIEGDLDQPEEMRGFASLSAQQVGFGGYRAEELHIEAQYSHSDVVVKCLALRDQAGTLQGELRWSKKAASLPFSLTSTADMPALLRAMGPWPQLREVIFYRPGNFYLEAAGKWHLGGVKEGEWPFEALGRVECGKFNTRGVVFDSVQFDYCVRTSDFYVRDVRLEHQRGSVAGRALRQQGVWKYQGQVQLDPTVLAPFFSGETVRDWIGRFHFSDSSGIAAQWRGGGNDGEWDQWEHTADIHVTHFKYRDVALRRGDATLSIDPRQTTLTNLRLIRPEGELTVPRLVSDSTKQTVEVHDLRAKVDPVPIVQLFSPAVARVIADYRFSQPTAISMNGKFGIDANDTCEYAIQFQTDGSAQYSLPKQTVDLEGPLGTVTGTAAGLAVELRSRVRPGTTLYGATFKEAAEFWFKGDFDLTGKKTRSDTRWGLSVAAPGVTEFTFGGQPLPLHGLSGTCQFRRDHLDIERVSAGLMGGKVTSSGQIDRFSTTQDYSAALQFDGISFGALATLYSPGTQTGGELSGGLRFVGSSRPEEKVRGSGSGTIRDGNIFAIPLLGPLSPLVAAVLPGTKASYGQARQASADFSIQNGVFTVKDFRGLTTAFVIKGGGDVNYETKEVDLEARINTRGPAGVLLFPVSKLLEYEALGTAREPGWRPKVFGLPARLIPGRRNPRKLAPPPVPTPQ
ncbi:MAG: AsmA-like C-terminal region-containing protein [Verrucomicrobiales bacterium]